MESIVRRYDIDWLRVIAIGLLIMYHIGFVFLPWGVFIGFMQNDTPMESLWIPMSMLNIWRIPLLFFVSGMGVCFAIKKRSWGQLILERTRRILVPFLFGICCIVPLHLLLWQKYYAQDLAYSIRPSHLWFLGNIFIYVLVLSPLFFYLKKSEDSGFNRWLKKVFGSPLGLIFMATIFVCETLLVKPESFETYAMTIHGFSVGLLAFLFGFLCIHTGEAFWHVVKKWRWILLIMATLLFLLRYFLFQMDGPNYLKAIESNSWIFAVFGFGYTYLNRPGKKLRYLSQAAYPIYILHMLFLYLGTYLILPLNISDSLKLILVIIFTLAGCLVFYEMIVRRIRIIKPLFGIKN